MQKNTGFGKEKSHLSSGQWRPHGMAKIHELRYELLSYSPDLAPSDFHLFPKLKIFLGGQKFSTMEELTAELKGYFADLEESHF
jgi:hypothetical protein